MKRLSTNTKGLILAETLLAVTILAGVTIVLGSVFKSANDTMLSSRNYLVAQNLATEAIEAAKHIRDTNWLQNGDKPSCWLLYDPSLGRDRDDQDCRDDRMSIDEEDADQIQHHILTENDGKWIFNKVLSLDSDVRIQGNADYKINGDYYRSVNVLQSAEDSAGDYEVIIRANVQWLEGARFKQVVRDYILTNY